VAVAATGQHSRHHAREMTMRFCWGRIDRARPTGHGQGCCTRTRRVGDTRRPGGGDCDGGGYKPRLLLSRRRTRGDGRDRRTCYSACNSGASEGAANGDVAYESASDSGWVEGHL
jgi:hypothetical protein